MGFDERATDVKTLTKSQASVGVDLFRTPAKSAIQPMTEKQNPEKRSDTKAKDKRSADGYDD